MQALLDDPMVQAGVAPFLVALVLGRTLASTRLAWLAIGAAVAVAFAMSTGIGFTPLSASRKIMLLVLLAPLLGVAIDLSGLSHRLLAPALALLSGLATLWVFQSVLAQRGAADALVLGGGVAIFVALLVHLCLRLRDDGVAAGAATVGLGLAVGVAAILSASLGNMMNGIALAVAGAALMLLQLVRGSAMVPGFNGMLTVGVAAALFAAATFVLAELRWHALLALLPVPLVAAAPLYAKRSPRVRVVLLGLTCVLVALPTILAAWLATRFPAS